MTHISVWHGCHDDIRWTRVRAPRMRSRDTMSAASSLDSAGLPAGRPQPVATQDLKLEGASPWPRGVRQRRREETVTAVN